MTLTMTLYMIQVCRPPPHPPSPHVVVDVGGVQQVLYN